MERFLSIALDQNLLKESALSGAPFTKCIHWGSAIEAL